MPTIQQETRRKLELVDRYRSRRLEELATSLYEEAQGHADAGRYAWKGEFRSKEEILELYRQRKRWDRRFLVDMVLLLVLCAALLAAGSQAIRIFSPRPTLTQQG